MAGVCRRSDTQESLRPRSRLTLGEPAANDPLRTSTGLAKSVAEGSLRVAIVIPTMPRPKEDALRALAKRIGHQLPPSYVDLVNDHDGAAPEENSLATSNNEVGVSRFIPVSEAATRA